MWRKILKVSLASLFLLGSLSVAQAEEWHIDGLGTVDLGKEVTVTDGSASQLHGAMVAGTHRKDYGKTARAAMWSVLTVPPGMNLYPEKAPFPYDTMKLYQIRKTDVRGTYSAGLFVVKGTAEDFFHEGNPKAAHFWESAFREDAKRPVSLFGMPKIGVHEFQALMDQILAEKKDQSMKVKILSFTPWRAIKNQDGSYRWGQEAKVIITNELGLSFPLWISSTLFKEGNTYYLIEVNGSHAAEAQLSDALLFGFYRMRRGL